MKVADLSESDPKGSSIGALAEAPGSSSRTSSRQDRDAIVHSRPLILVADDDLVMRLMAQEALRQFGFEVVAASDGAEAVEIWTRMRPDVVLLDVQMPGLDGFQTCSRIREREDGKLVPILIMTTMSDQASIDCAYDVGATDFVTKPVNWVIIQQRLRSMLRAKAAVDALAESESRIRALLSAIPDMMLRMNADGVLVDLKEPLDLNAFAPGAAAGKRIDEILPEAISDLFRKNVTRTLQTGEGQVFEYSLPLEGRLREFECRCEVSGQSEILALVRDVTDRRQAESRIYYMAHYDDLTGLANKTHFLELVEQALAIPERRRRPVAVLFINIDQFRQINNALGHASGDRLLKAVAERLRSFARLIDPIARPRIDGVEESIARFGGDEFTLLIADLPHGKAALGVAQRLHRAFADPFVLDGREVFISIGIGMSVYPEDGEDSDALIRKAGMAMRYAKTLGRSRSHFYASFMNAEMTSALELESGLRRAVSTGEFSLHYQPKVSVAEGALVGVEALIRWNHPTRGMVFPGEFIPSAEDSELIIPIGEWALQTACAQLRAWIESGITAVPIAVNLSPVQFKHAYLLQTAGRIISSAGVDPTFLELEVTESTIMRNERESAATLRGLKDLGVRLSIDDFGTGYSSLSVLKRMRMDALKIDQSFIKELASSADDRALVNAIIVMARSLGMHVVAEGIETEAQFSVLRELGCDTVQGYWISPAIPAARLTQLLWESGQSAFASVVNSAATAC